MKSLLPLLAGLVLAGAQAVLTQPRLDARLPCLAALVDHAAAACLAAAREIAGSAPVVTVSVPAGHGLDELAALFQPLLLLGRAVGLLGVGRWQDRDLAFESNGSTAVSTLTMGSTGAVEVQVPNSTDAQVDAIVVYARNKTSGETVKRKASSFAMQGGAHSTVTITSTAWGKIGRAHV